MTSIDRTSPLYDSDWEGNVDRLAVDATSVLAACGLDDDPLNERLIRDYTQRGIISRPDRQRRSELGESLGRLLIYGRRHLLELVAARVLVKDGWPLAKIAEHLPNVPDTELLALIPGQAKESRPLSVARRLLRENALSSPAPSPATHPDRQSAATAFRQRAARVSGLQAELRDALQRLGLNPNDPPTRQLTLIVVAPWCQMLIDSSRLPRVAPDEAEEIGRAVSAMLLDPTIRKGSK